MARKIDYTNPRHGAAIRSLRLQCTPPMRQGELRERLGLSVSRLSDLELGKTRCTVPMARAIAVEIARRSDIPAWRAAVAIVMGEEEG
jgi:hypothetical protein